MSEIQHTDEVVTKDYLANFYQGILPYLGGSIPTFANMFNRSDILETTEKVVGGFLGKPLYQKVVPIPSTATTTNVITTIDIITDATFEDVFFVDGFVNTSAVSVNLLSFCYEPASANSWWSRLVYLRDTGKLYLNIKVPTVTTLSGYVVVRYTKKSDVAGSFHGASSNDYSTDEHVVGTWIDSKPLYQKTVSYGALPNATTKDVTVFTANTVRVRNLSAYSYRSSDGFSIVLPRSNATLQNNISLDIIENQTKLRVITAQDYSSFTETYVTLQYTKTAD